MNFLKILQRTHRHFLPFPHYRHLSSSTTTNNAKDLIKNAQLELQNQQQQSPPDILIQNLKSAVDTTEVFDMICEGHKEMTPPQVMQSLRTLFTLKKSGNSTLHTGQILKHPEFENLCYNVRSKAKFMELNDIIESLKILNFLGVSSKSEIVCILLTHIKNQINELNLAHIIFLEFLLRKYDNTNLVEALRMALPMLFQIQVNYKMDHENVQQLTELLMFISRYRVNEQCTTSVVTALTMHGRKIPAKLAVSIIWSLTDIKKYHPMFEKLLQNCCRVLINSMKNQTVDFGMMERTLTRMVDKYILRYPSFYNEELFNAICSYTVEENVGFTKTMYVLKKLNRISFVNLTILEYLAAEVASNPTHLVTGQAGVVFTFSGAFSIANHKPEGTWPACQAALLENQLLKSDRNDLPWIKFSLDFLCLDIFEHQLFRRVFQEGFLEHFLSRANNTLDYLQLLALYQAVKLLVPNYEGPFPHERFLKTAYEIHCNKLNFPLRDALEILFGGVRTRVTSKYWHFIDHVVVFDTTTGQVVANEEKSEFSDEKIENLMSSPNHKVIAIISLPPSHYAHNVNRVKGIFSLRLRTMQTMNIPTVVVCQQEWLNRPENEKLPFLEREVRSLL